MVSGYRGVGWEEQRSRRFFRSGELHLVLLALLGSRPQHGYELLSELAARFGPAYQPSPGSVYPALSALEAEGLLLAEDDGGGTLPALNRKGHHNRVATPRPAAKMGRLRLEIEGSLGDHFVPSH